MLQASEEKRVATTADVVAKKVLAKREEGERHYRPPAPRS